MKKELQKEYDDLLKKIEEQGFSLQDGKIKKVKKILTMDLEANYYSHYDGHTNDAIYKDDGYIIEIPQEIAEKMSKLNTIEIEVKVSTPSSRYSGPRVNYIFDGTILEEDMGLEMDNTKFDKSFETVDKLTFIKKNDLWELDYENCNLIVDFDMEEHNEFTFTITEMNKFE